MNVLIVDDSKAMQNIITKAMKSVGYMTDNYSYACDGEEALQIIRRERPDLVLCDMHMPKMTGLEVLAALRSAKDSTKVIIVSIDNDEKTVQNITATGGDAYLKKPFTAEQLFKTVTGLLGRAAPIHVPDVNVTELIPSIPVIERVLGSLAGSDMQWTKARYTDVDYSCSPYYGGTFQDDQGRLVLGVFLDALTANTIAAIINRVPLQNAVDAARAKQLGAATKQSVLAFFGLFGALCKPSKSGQLLEVQAEHYAEDAQINLGPHLHRYAETLMVYSINCGPCRDGKIILMSP